MFRLQDHALLLQEVPECGLAQSPARVQDPPEAPRDGRPHRDDPPQAAARGHLHGVQRPGRRGPPPRDVQGVRLPGVWLMRVPPLERDVLLPERQLRQALLPDGAPLVPLQRPRPLLRRRPPPGPRRPRRAAVPERRVRARAARVRLVRHGHARVQEGVPGPLGVALSSKPATARWVWTLHATRCPRIVRAGLSANPGTTGSLWPCGYPQVEDGRDFGLGRRHPGAGMRPAFAFDRYASEYASRIRSCVCTTSRLLLYFMLSVSLFTPIHAIYELCAVYIRIPLRAHRDSCISRIRTHELFFIHRPCMHLLCPSSCSSVRVSSIAHSYPLPPTNPYAYRLQYKLSQCNAIVTTNRSSQVWNNSDTRRTQAHVLRTRTWRIHPANIRRQLDNKLTSPPSPTRLDSTQSFFALPTTPAFAPFPAPALPASTFSFFLSTPDAASFFCFSSSALSEGVASAGSLATTAEASLCFRLLFFSAVGPSAASSAAAIAAAGAWAGVAASTAGAGAGASSAAPASAAFDFFRRGFFPLGVSPTLSPSPSPAPAASAGAAESFAIALVTGVSATAPAPLVRFLRFAGVSPARPSAGVLGGFAGTARAAGVAAAVAAGGAAAGESKRSTADARRFFFCAAGVVGAGDSVTAGAEAGVEDASEREARAFLRFSFFGGGGASASAAGAG